jgi:hypothetical protein
LHKARTLPRANAILFCARDDMLASRGVGRLTR